LDVPGPFEIRGDDEPARGNVNHSAYVALRVGDDVHDVEIESRDLLVSVTVPLEGDVEGIYLGDRVELPSHERLRVFLSHPQPPYLIVLEDGTTAIALVIRIEDESTPQRDAIVAAIAAQLVPGEPPETVTEWSISLGLLRVEMTLPDDYAIWHDEVMYEGLAWRVASHVTPPAASLRFETLGGADPPPRRRVRRRPAMLGDRPIEIVIERGRGLWVAPVDCGCGRECQIELEGDEAERERLLAALASARVTRRQFTEDDVQVRERPEDGAPSVGRIWPSREVWILEPGDEWTRIRGRNSPTAPHRLIEGWVHTDAIGDDCD